MKKVGRNEACPCGSGKKSKRCCEAQDSSPKTSTRFILVQAGAALAAAIIGGVMSGGGDQSAGAGRVWSEEHGHYHDQ